VTNKIPENLCFATYNGFAESTDNEYNGFAESTDFVLSS